MKKPIRLAVFLVCILAFPVWGLELFPQETAAVINEQGKILQYQKSLEQFTIFNKEDLYKKPQKFVERPIVPLKSLRNGEPTQNKPVFSITTINVTGVKKISKRVINRTIAPYKGRSMTVEDVVELAKILTNEYLRRGYVTSRITVPEQNLKTGVLNLVAVEGKLEAIVMVKDKEELQKKVKSGSARRWSLKESLIFPWLEGRVVQLKDLEQGIDQLNRLRSCNGDMSIIPSEEEGYSTIVILTNQAAKKAWATAQVDTGAFGANDFRPGTGFSIEDVLGLNESWYFNLTDEGRYKSSNTQSRIVSGSLPWGYWTFSGQYSKSAYLNRLKPLTRYIDNTGSSESYVLGLDRVLWRGASSRASAFAQYSGFDVESMIEDTVNQASTFKLTIIRTGLNYSLGTSLGSFSTSVGYHRGVGWGNAKEDAPGLSAQEPHAQFEKYVGSGSFFRPSIWLGWPVSFRSTVQVQYAKKSLYSSERMGIGGVFSVRGTSESLSGEKGVLIRNDLSLPFAALWDKPVIRHHSLAFTVDGGYVWSMDRYSSYGKGGAIGAGLNLNGRKDNIWWGLSYSWPLKVSSFLEKQAGQFNASVGVEF